MFLWLALVAGCASFSLSSLVMNIFLLLMTSFCTASLAFSSQKLHAESKREIEVIANIRLPTKVEDIVNNHYLHVLPLV